MIQPIKPIHKIQDRAAKNNDMGNRKKRHITGRPFSSIIRDELLKLK